MSTTNAPAAASANAVAQQPKKIDVLKSMLNAPSVMEQFRNALGKNATGFVASIIDLYNSDSNLQLCDPKQVTMEALKAAVLKLPINKSLGFAFIIPFNNTKKVVANGREQWVKVMEPTFQLGYKGLIQLAIRSGQYRCINADAVYEGETVSFDRISGRVASITGERTSDAAVGYFAHIELLNGYTKDLYMSVREMANHAKRFSKGLSKSTTVESLEALAKLPVAPDSKAVGWTGNFHGMALKTVLRLLLSKYGCLSIEMQQGIQSDAEGDQADVRDAMVQETAAARESFDMGNEADFEEVPTDAAPAAAAPAPAPAEEPNPGF